MDIYEMDKVVGVLGDRVGDTSLETRTILLKHWSITHGDCFDLTSDDALFSFVDWLNEMEKNLRVLKQIFDA